MPDSLNASDVVWSGSTEPLNRVETLISSGVRTFTLTGTAVSCVVVGFRQPAAVRIRQTSERSTKHGNRDPEQTFARAVS